MDDNWIPYLAGFFDADGGVSLYARRSGHELKAYVSQVNPAVLNMLHDRFGGRVSGPYKNGPGARLIYHWNVYASEAAGFLAVVLPWLVNKRRQAEIALEYRKDARHRNRIPADLRERRTKLWEEMKELNARGLR